MEYIEKANCTESFGLNSECSVKSMITSVLRHYFGERRRRDSRLDYDGRWTTFNLGRFLVIYLGLVLVSVVAWAQNGEYSVFLDLDNNLSTGCTVTTIEGPFDGVEEILSTTVMVDDVTLVRRSLCDEGSGVFGVPTVVGDFPVPWPVGNSLGTDGTDVIEVYFPLHTLSETPLAIRIGFGSNDGFGGEDALLTTDGLSTGLDIVVLLGSVIEIPVLSPFSLLFLSMLLGLVAWGTLRQRTGAGALRSTGALLCVLILCGFMVGVIILDGDPSDWTGSTDASGLDPFADAPASADLRAGFAAVDSSRTFLYLRLDATRGILPIAVDDLATVAEDDPATPLDVLANENNPDAFPLAVTAITTQPPNGTVIITNAGADLTYEPDPDYCNDGTPTDDFVYELNSDSTASVAVTVGCVDDPPTITAIANQSIPEDGTTGPLAFTVADIDTVLGALVLSASSSDQGVIPDANLTLGGAGANRTITVTPAADQNGGPVTITVLVDDGTTAVPETFEVLVNAVDDPPTLTPIADQIIAEDGTTGAIAFTIGDIDTPLGSLVVSASSDDQGLIPDGNLSLGGAGANRTITAVPSTDENGGPVTLTVTVDDGTTLVPETFGVTVTPVNDEPSFTAGASESIAEDAGLQTVAGWATAIDDGDPEVVQVLTFDLTNDNNALFSQQPALSPTGTLTYRPADDANGSATVTVTLMDDGGTANPGDDDTSPPSLFTIDVSAVNDPPTHTPGGGLATFTEDLGPVVVDGGITVADVDSPQLVSATLTLGILDAGLEVLAASTGGTSIVAFYNGGTGVLALTGSDTLANYQSVLRSVTYNNASQAPNSTNRTISCMLNDGIDPSLVANLTVSVISVNDPPSVANTTIDYDAVGNTLLRVDGADADNHDTPLPGRIASSADLIDAFIKAGITDVDGPSPGFTPKAAEATDQGGLLTLDDDGDFFYLPPANFTGLDTETLNVTDGIDNVPVTLQINVTDVVWYVEDTVDGVKNPAGGDGRSTDAFETLAGAEAASGTGHYILLFETDAPLDEGIVLKSGQRFYGQRVEEEAVSLLPTGLILEEIADTNARPQIHRTTGVAVTVDASGGALNDVEIRHLDLESGDDDAISVETAGTNIVNTLLIDENVIGAAGAHGIDVNADHSTGEGTLEIRDNQITSTSSAIDVHLTGAGDLSVQINGNTNLTSTSARGLNLVETSGSLTVTSLANNSVHGDTAGDGMSFNGVSFDADTSTLAFEAVPANNTAIGSGGNGVGGSGLVIAAGDGDLVFGDLDVEAGGSGIVASGTGEVNVGAGTGFRLTTASGSTVTANGGPALSLDPMTANTTFAALIATNSPTQGIFLSDIAGSVTAQSGSITGSGADAVYVDQDTVSNSLDLTYSGAITNTAGYLVRVEGYPTGTMSFNGASLSDSGAGGNTGQGLFFEDVDGTINLSATNTVLTQSEGPGIEITGDSDGAINFDNVTLIDAAGTAILVNGGGTSSGSFDFDNVDVNHATNNQAMVAIQGLAAGSVNFDAASALVATDGLGIRLQSNVSNSSITLSGPVDLGTGASRISDGQAFLMSGNSGGTTVTAADIDIFTSGQMAASASGSGTLDIDALTINTVSNGRGLDLTGIVSQVDADGITCSNNSACVNLSNLGAGSTTTFAGLTLTCSGGACFDAIGARTVEATGSVSDIDATNAIGLRLVNTTLGNNDFTLRSVDASGGTNGIVLTNTGTNGGLNILGDGSTAQGGNASGGWIQNTSGVGVLVNQTHELNLSRLRVLTPGSHGILADQMTGQGSITYSTIEDVDVPNTSGLWIRNDNLNLNAGTGFRVGDSIFRNATTGQVMVLVEGRGNSQMILEVDNSLFEDLVPDAYQHAAGLDPGDTATVNTTFSNNTVRNARAAVGSSVINFGKAHGGNSEFLIADNVIQNIGIPGVNGGAVNISASADNAGGFIAGTIRGNRLENIQGRRRGINITPEPASGSVSSVTVTIEDNDINDMTNGIGLYVDIRENVPLSNIRVINNRIGTGSFGTTAGNMGGTRDGVFIQADDPQPKVLNVLFSDNIVHVTNVGSGTTSDQAVVIKADNDNCTVNATVLGNTILQGAGGSGDFVFESEGVSSYCLDLNASNAGANANSAATGIVLERETTATFHIEGMGAGPHNNAAVEAFLDPRNSNHVLSPVGNGFTNNGGAGCPTPP